ncbi:peptidoglycan DD-metalloendopeptidase family protein [[Phormidium] sp. ETS-05]|uniref:peptidoglycan DD-metalloendopeptidase family protein n=1 Tax=[Phormidium] sp. ETS-05 TaxID=222819 RepID=UPI0018EF0702|nr:peptidoglycan DD-metalloendopeptidase family protein [[Phormidium] sp. ETS-05]
MKPVTFCAAGNQAIPPELMVKSVLAQSHRRARTSAATLALAAISMGASSVLLPHQNGAMASEPLVATNTPGLGETTGNSQLTDSALEAAPSISLVSENLAPGELPEAPENQTAESGATPSDLEPVFGSLDLEATLPVTEPTSFPAPWLSSDIPTGVDTSFDINQPGILGHQESQTNLTAPQEASNPALEPAAAPAPATTAPLELSATSAATTPALLPTQPSTTLGELTSSPSSDSLRFAGGIPQQSLPTNISAPLPPSGFANPSLTLPEAAPQPTALTPQLETQKPAALEALTPIETESATSVIPEVPAASTTNSTTAATDDLEADMTGAVVVAGADNVANTWTLYKVKPGDTLENIARATSVSVPAIIEANQLTNPNFIEPDRELKIPLNPTANPVAENQGWSVSSTEGTVSFPAGTASLLPVEPSVSLPLPTAVAAQPVQEETAGLPKQDKPGKDKDRKWEIAADSPVTPPASEDEGLTTAAVFNPYVEDLRADLNRLRNKYGEQTPTGSGEAIEPAIAEMDATEAIPARGYESAETDRMAAAPEAGQNPYSEGLRSDIQKLQQQYQSQPVHETSVPDQGAPDQGAMKVAPAAVTAWAIEQFLPLPNLNPESNLEIQNEALPADINQNIRAPQERTEVSFPPTQAPVRQMPTLPVATQPEPTPAPSQPAEQVVAVAPLGYEAYQMEPTTGRMVSPQIPPLPGPDKYLPASPPAFNGYIWPAQGVMTSGYGWRWGRMHKGIDIAAPIGTPIYAAAPGKVTFAGWNDGGYGNLVEIEHPDGSSTIYAHNNRIVVQEGQEVDQGEQVAEMGSTGFSTGPHLHFEIHLPGQGATNPMAYLPRER